MLRCTSRPGFCLLGVVALGLVIGRPSAATASEQSCVALSSRNSRADIETFKRDPARHLTYLRGDSDKIQGFVVSYIASAPDLLVPLRQFIARANGEERRAIGMGLAGAAAACARTLPVANAEIAKYVVKVNDPDISAGFLSQSPARRVSLPPPGRPGPAGGRLLIEGEHGEKLADPFADIPLPR